jgi:2-polyprenyl-3-methyl-5-hydroxy-6-metoxy-1,4-benzoquinol methylase
MSDSKRASRDELESWYTSGVDPWRFASVSRDRYRAALRMIDGVFGDRSLPRALEIGCAEGLFTSMLGPRCAELLAIDVSAVALERARERCVDQPTIRFAQGDVREGLDLGRFDLVVCMDVIDSILRPVARRIATSAVADCVGPDGHLLVSAVTDDPSLKGIMAASLGRGGARIMRRFAREGSLRPVESVETELHLVTLFEAGGDG